MKYVLLETADNMGWFERIMTSSNAWMFLVLLLAIILVAIFLSKRGLLTISTDNIKVGAASKEREIIRRQTEWVRLHCDGYEAMMSKPQSYDIYRGKWIAELVYDEYVKMITYNHITDNAEYIRIKQELIVNLVYKVTELDYFRSEEFTKALNDDVEYCIKQLLNIRKMSEEDS